MAFGIRLLCYSVFVASVLTLAVYLTLSSFEIQELDEINNIVFGSKYFSELNFSSHVYKKQLTISGNTGAVNIQYPFIVVLSDKNHTL